MKSITKMFFAVGLLSMSFTVSAQNSITWSQKADFAGTHKTRAIMADLNDDGWLDIYYGGQFNFLNSGWEWQIASNLYLNDGNGGWIYDGYQRIPHEEYSPRVDEVGNPIFDETTGEMVMDTIVTYERVWPKSGLPGNSYSVYQSLDYNNDGLVDLLIMGRNEWDIFDNAHPEYYTYLYKNIGEGKFEVVADAVFPMFYQESDKTYFCPVAVGDYNRDGYTDLLFSVMVKEKEADNYPGRAVYLYRNEGGTGVFTMQNIAETKGGVWTSEVTDEQGAVITEKEELKGYFAPISGNAIFADVNNDGWLDILVNGWSDVPVSEHVAGNNGRIYISQNGEKFVDVTSELPSFHTLRNSSACIGDVNLDGYIDWLMTGWGDNGGDTHLFLGNGMENAFEDPLNSDLLLLNKGVENVTTYIRDFNADGFFDILYTGQGNENDVVWFGNESGTFDRDPSSDCIRNQSGTVGDIDNDGLCDYFVSGYTWYWYPGYDWNWAGYAGLNTNTYEAEVVAPEAPTNVTAACADGKLNITWEYDTDVAVMTGLVYNIFVKKADGSVYTMIPANIENGFIKVADNRETGIRPTITSYSLTMPEGEYTVGVQAVSTMTASQSLFTTATTTTSGVESVVSNAEVVAVEYYNLQGQKLNVAPEAGAYIVKSIKADGSVESNINVK